MENKEKKEIVEMALTLIMENHKVMFGQLLNECENKNLTNYAREAFETAHKQLGIDMKDTSMKIITKLLDKQV